MFVLGKKQTSEGNGEHYHSNQNGYNANCVVGNEDYANQNGNASKDNEIMINLENGDPMMFYPYWKTLDEECSITIKASDLLSYFVNPAGEGAFVFQMPGLDEAARRVHRVVGNAVTDGRYIIGGTGSSQLFICAVRALASTVNTGDKKRVPVVCAEPYYSYYEETIEAEKSGLYEWRGDANSFKEEGGAYIEIVTTPNNPDGACREAVVKREGGLLIHDLAYYWPQYTPITAPADYDIMLFTMSKATGHAGSRVGWAIVKDPEIASKIMNQVAQMSIGCCQEGQLRATKILQFIADSYEQHVAGGVKTTQNQMVATSEKLFEFGHRIMEERWQKLRAVVKRTGVFTLPHFPPKNCTFFGKTSHATPAFAWMECNKADAAQIIKQLNVEARGGSRFGSSVSEKYARVSLLGSEDGFNLFLERLTHLT